jgi:hypothetical protein
MAPCARNSAESRPPGRIAGSAGRHGPWAQGAGAVTGISRVVEVVVVSELTPRHRLPEPRPVAAGIRESRRSARPGKSSLRPPPPKRRALQFADGARKESTSSPRRQKRRSRKQ